MADTMFPATSSWDRELGWHTIAGNPDRKLSKWYQENSVEEIILVAHHYWSGTLLRAGWWEIDEEKYAKTLSGIRVPGGPARRIPIPNDYDGWICIDIETAYMQPFRFPHDYTDEEAIEASLIFERVIMLTHMLRPNVKISLYNIVSGMSLQDFPFRWKLIRSMYSLCDGIDCDVYRHSWMTDDQSEQVIHDLRFDKCIRISQELSIPFHVWTWHKQHGTGNPRHPNEKDAHQWYDRWDPADVTGFWMFWNETAPQWFRDQQRQFMS